MSRTEDRQLPAGVVFDCDGTIADTESLSSRAWTETLAAYGYPPSAADFAVVIGHPFPHNWSYFSARADLGQRDVFRAQLRERFVDLFDRELVIYSDAVTTMRALHRAGVAIAVASSSSHGHVDRVLERAELTALVSAVVGADDVQRHKPDPEPYLTAAAALRVEPTHCTAIEDTAVGLTSALSAGMFSVGIVRAHGTPAGLSEGHRVVDELTIEVVYPDGRTGPDYDELHD